MPIKILAVVSEPVSGDALKAAIGADRAEEAEVLVVAPALNTRARYWLSDPDSAVGRADDVQQETVERMDEQGGDAVGDTRRIRSPPLSQPLWWCLEWASDESEVLALSTSEEEPVGNGRRQAGDPREFPSVHSK